MPEIALLTDSTWSMPAKIAAELGIEIVPLHVAAGDLSLTDTPGNEPQLKELLAKAKHPTTSQPSPGEIRAAFEKLADQGAREIVAVHLSGGLSATAGSVAQLAADFQAERGVSVEVIDSQKVGAAVGFAVVAAGRVIAAGGTAADAVAAARRVADAARVLITVADLRHLHRGGRLKASQSLFGAALGVRPILEVVDGGVRLLESQRGAARTRRRLVELAVQAAQVLEREFPEAEIDLAVQHNDDDEAARCADELRHAAADAGIKVTTFLQGRISSVLAVHGGPGTLAVTVAPHFTQRSEP